jgi:20S proteasome alpha/beta subunit
LTLVVAILCGEEGAVIAADRQASLGSFGTLTVAHPVTKIKILSDGKALFASSGSMGLGQQLESIFEAQHNSFGQQPFQSAIVPVQANLRNVLVSSYRMAELASKMNPSAWAEASCVSLVAGSFQDGLRVAETDTVGNFTHLTKDMPFTSIGSGKANADPILRYLWTIYYSDDHLPTLREGTLLAFWTVKVVIEHLKSFGVGFDADVFVLSRDEVDYKASQVDEADLRVHAEFIAAAEEAMRNVQQPQAEVEEPPTLGESTQIP